MSDEIDDTAADAVQQAGERRADERRTALSRRRFLAVGAGAAAAGGLGGSPASAQTGAGHAGHAGGAATEGLSIVRRVPFTPGRPLVEPEVRRSAGGLLETTLRCRYAWNDIGDYRLFTRTYEGTVPGPTLRVRPGDTMRIRLVNELPPNREPMPAYMDQPHGLNTTNLHFHGSHVSPGGISDNVLRSMQPGSSYDVEFDLADDHPRGTYWYHPHHHGSADIQMASGMVAAIVIEGDFDEVPEIRNARERLLVLSEVVFDAFGMVEDFGTLFPETAARFFTVNGQRAPTISMRPGEVQRWRMLHAGYQDDFFLKLAGHRMHMIARDGIQLARMGGPDIRTNPNAGEPDAILIAPGQRVDVLVKAGAPGTYDLAGMPYDQGYPSPTGLFAKLVVAGEPLPMPLPAALPPPPLRTIADAEITGRRTLTFSAVTPEVDAAGHWQEFRFMIDGKVFDPNRVDQRVRLGAVEEWTVVNEHKDDHVFHIHVNPFQLVKINGQPVEPVWLDTVPMPRFGSITFRSRFEDFAGKFVLHCHMMNHEELGMMQIVEVYEG